MIILDTNVISALMKAQPEQITRRKKERQLTTLIPQDVITKISKSYYRV